MNQLLKRFRETFLDKDYRYAYAESFMNSYIAAQIKILREENALTQEELARLLSTRKGTISRMEDVSYESWTLGMLKKVARAFGLRLKISFEEFGSLVREIEGFKRAELTRLPFDRDPAFLQSSSEGSLDTALELQKKTPQGKGYPSQDVAWIAWPGLGEIYDDARRRWRERIPG